MLLLLSVLLKLAGTGFLCIAALGVMKLPDPFQHRIKRAWPVEIGRLAGLAIQLPAARGEHHRAQRCQGAAQFSAHLAIAAEDQNRHATNSGSRSAAISARNGARWSLSDNCGSLIGQSTAICASFQATPASASRT